MLHNNTRSKEEFLARCANAYDCGLITTESLQLLNGWVDTMMRLEHSLFSMNGQSQLHTVWDFLAQERERLRQNNLITLAGDDLGYKLIQLTSILAHTCQKCAVDPHAWWTRSAFCEHRKSVLRDTPETEDE